MTKVDLTDERVVTRAREQAMERGYEDLDEYVEDVLGRVVEWRDADPGDYVREGRNG